MIKTYFKNLDQLKEYLTVDISSDFEVVLPYLNQAKKFIIDIIGEELHKSLIDYLHTEPSPSADVPFDNLIEMVRPVCANFGYLLAIPKLNINVGNTGFTVTTSSNLEPASQWRVDEFRKSVEDGGYDAQEELLKFLEQNKTDYPTWVSSNAYSFNKNLFVNNALEFYQTILVDITRINFLKIKHFILQIENFDIKGSIGKALFDEIKSQIKSGSISSANQILLSDFIKPSVCYLSYNKLIADETFYNEGTRLIRELREYLNTNADTYPLYKNSSLYEVKISEEYNSEDSGVYFFR